MLTHISTLTSVAISRNLIQREQRIDILLTSSKCPPLDTVRAPYALSPDMITSALVNPQSDTDNLLFCGPSKVHVRWSVPGGLFSNKVFGLHFNGQVGLGAEAETKGRNHIAPHTEILDLNRVIFHENSRFR